MKQNSKTARRIQCAFWLVVLVLESLDTCKNFNHLSRIMSVLLLEECDLETDIIDGTRELNLPSKMALVSMCEHKQFYGDFIAYRLSQNV